MNLKLLQGLTHLSQMLSAPKVTPTEALTLTEVQSLAEIVQKMEAEIQQVMNSYRPLAGKLIYQMAQNIFDQFSEIEVLYWEQYVPYFNDGEECVFNIQVDGMYYRYKTNLLKYADGWLEEEDLEGAGEVISKEEIDALDSRIDEIQTYCRDFWNFIYNHEDLLRDLFGNHSLVKLRRGSAEAEVEEFTDHH